MAVMQKEAEERVRAMQERARLLTGAGFPPPPPKGSFEMQKPSAQSGSPFGMVSDFLGRIDSDKMIIMLLLWLLWSEKADSKLLLALVYIML